MPFHPLLFFSLSPWLPKSLSPTASQEAERVRLSLLGPWSHAVGTVLQLCFYRVLGCMPLIALAYFFLWFLPPFTSLRGLWYTSFYCLFQALATVSM